MDMRGTPFPESERTNAMLDQQQAVAVLAAFEAGEIADLFALIPFDGLVTSPDPSGDEDGSLTVGVIGHMGVAYTARHGLNVHTHPDYLPPTTGGSGSIELDDHGDDTFLELCATVTNSGSNVVLITNVW